MPYAYTLDLVSPFSTPSTPSVSQITEALKTHAKAGRDLAPIHQALEEINATKAAAEQKERILKTLKGVAELAKQGKAPRRFLMAYHHDDETDVTHGTEYKDGYVHVNSTEKAPAVLDGGHDSMESLKTKLSRNGITHHIEYLD